MQGANVSLDIKVQILLTGLITIASMQLREFTFKHVKDNFHLLISYFILKTYTSNCVLVFVGDLSSSFRFRRTIDKLHNVTHAGEVT